MIFSVKADFGIEKIMTSEAGDLVSLVPAMVKPLSWSNAPMRHTPQPQSKYSKEKNQSGRQIQMTKNIIFATHSKIRTGFEQ